MSKQIPDNHWLRNKPIAHRGLHDLSKGRPENSLAAFDAACKKGYPIELDVQITKDGVPVVFHDFSFFRMSGVRRLVSSTEANRIKTLKLLNTNEHIPLLEDVLKLVNGRVPILIEIKNFLLPGKLEDSVAKSLKEYKGGVVLASFNPFVVRYLYKNFPQYISGLIIGSIEQPLFPMLFNFTSCQFVFCLKSLGFSKLFKSFCQNKNLPIVAWTVKSKVEELKAREFADNIIFENYTPL